MARLLALLLWFVPAALAAAPFTPREAATVDAVVADALRASGVPSASVAVVRDGRIAFARAYGDQRGDRSAASPEARYAIASVSKQVVAGAVLLLAEEGRLSLDDKVAKWLPDLTGAGQVTVRQLLSHTSGYRDYWPQDYDFAAMARPTAPKAILDRWAKLPLDFAPGSQLQYSNTGYVAAGLIVEKAAGMPLMRFLETRLLKPAGVAGAVDTDYAMGARDAKPFHRFALGPVRAARPSAAGWLFAAGQLAMSASDLARWDIARIDRAVLTPASWDAQEREATLTDGRGTGYGLGVRVDKIADHRRVGHGGEAVGFLTENRVYPDDKAAVVVMVNADFGNVQGVIADRLEAMVLPDADTTRVARTLYDELRAGRLDRSRLTENGNYYFTAQAVADYRASLAPLGDPVGFVRVGTPRLRGGFTAESYLLTFASRKLRIVLRAEPGAGGKVEQFTVYPEN